MTTLRIIIADDETPARNRLRDLLGDIANVSVVAEAQNGKEAIELAAEHSPDLVLLDIRMPVMDGIEAAQHLQLLAQVPKLIFTTAYDAYAIKAFELNAIDYLLKPIRQERLETALNKVRALQPAQLASIKPLQPTRSHLSIHERGRVLLVPIHEIIYFRAEQKYVTVRTAVREYLVEESLTQLEVEFGELLLRLHRNCLVAKPFIAGFEKRTIVNDDAQMEQQWVAILKGVPETVAVSRRQQHLIKTI
ncbi:response regulator of the LytR/AlgR family [Methylophilaceae bacterium 11]|jgi:two-component system response regulator AlgR|nr:response regulator of the LytR/AlgR family [Methylophilaceae bacterium 11]